ncbi:MAG TPA: LLM class flavin-dependent oxidoreductase [Terriglobales bacterium]|nr:LLM class flavin-dependent oxidoreductase [Terriglobales bacterium]
MKPKFGIVLPTRGMLFAKTSARQDIVELSKLVEELGYDAVWAGDSVLAKPRLDSISVLSAAAGVTEKVKLGTACFASFPLRNPIILAYQWATLDCLSEGRSLLVVCQGTPTVHGKIYRNEFDAIGVPPREKVQRSEEGIEILRKLWESDDVSYDGEIFKFKNVTMLPKPVQQPCPIWIASNPRSTGELEGPPGEIEKNFDRVGKYADGWMTTMVSPQEFREDAEKVKSSLRKHKRDSDRFGMCLYYNVNMNDSKTAAATESTDFLMKYYREDPSGILDLWVAYGTQGDCVKKIQDFIDAGVDTFSIRFVAWNQTEQLKRFSKEVLPSF